MTALTEASHPFALRLAITGGIASGKSLVGKFLVEQGIPVIDADDVVHHLLASDETLKQNIVTHFGSSVLDEKGGIHRDRLGQKIFPVPADKKLLENWLHPPVRATIQAFYQQNKASHRVVASIIPLFFESSLEPYYDAVWLLDTPADMQLQRLIEHRGMIEEEALHRINIQMPIAEKRERLKGCKQACLIENHTTVDDLLKQVSNCLEECLRTKAIG
jgi:dephospho-CoA kinase